jgi:hypothetical protein
MKMDIGYYTLVAQTILNLGVFLCILICISHPILILQPEAFQSSPLWISKRVLQTVPVSQHNDIDVQGRWDFLKSLLWLFLPMQGFEHLLPPDDCLIKDPVLSYTVEQLHHHVVA